MRIAFVADLHYCGEDASLKYPRSSHEALAGEIHASKPDVIMVGGDVAESYADPALLGQCLDIYGNPFGASLLVPGNHDVWCRGTTVDAEEKYEWNLRVAREHGWVPLWNTPWSVDDVWFVGNMGWYDLRSCPKWIGFGPKYYEAARNWSDYYNMCKLDRSEKTPMLDFCRRRMGELDVALAQVPEVRRGLVVMTHIVGFEELLGIFDENTAFFGNMGIGKRVAKARATHYLCGHTHVGKKARIRNVECINNGSDYGCKNFDMVEI